MKAEKFNSRSFSRISVRISRQGKMSNKKLLKIFIILTASFCCSYQLYNTFQTYFTYATVSRMELIGTHILELLSVSLCVPYLSFLNIDFVKKKFDVDLSTILNTSENIDYEQYRDIVEDKITIREILDQTYGTDKIITTCSMRFISSRYYNRTNDTKFCNELFKVRKYFTQDSICYLFEPKQIDVPTSNYFTATMFPGVKYSIGLNDSFSQHMRYYKFIVHSKTWLPFTSKNYAEVRRTNNPTKERYNIKFRRYWMKYLGYPYSEFTCTNDKYALSECREQCIMNHTIKKYGRIVYDLDTSIPYNYPAITKKQTESSKISSEIDDIILKCINSCKTKYCLFDYTTTTFDHDKYSYTAMYVKTPRSPDTISITLPFLQFLDLFVYTMGALGSWFGFAFIHSFKIFESNQKQNGNGTNSTQNMKYHNVIRRRDIVRNPELYVAYPTSFMYPTPRIYRPKLLLR